MLRQVLPLLLMFTLEVSLINTVQAWECPLPGNCTCTEVPANPGAIDVDCSALRLTVFPDLSSLKGVVVHRLILDNNHIEAIHPNAFNSLEIQGLQMNSNPLSIINQTALEGLADHLVYLSLSRTNLMTPPKEFLFGMLKLRTLDLSHPKSELLKQLAKEFFGVLPNLEVLNLASGGIRDIDPEAFKGVEGLSELHLAANRLNTVPEAIRLLTNVEVVILRKASLTEVPSGSFHGLTKLRSLDLSDNSLHNTSISPEAFGDSATNLQELILRINDLRQVPVYLFDTMKKLVRLNLRDNMIQDIPAEAFIHLDSLEELDIGYNDIELHTEVLSGVADTLLTLNIPYIKMNGVIPREALKPLKKLQHLDLTGNDLPLLPAHAFSGLTARKITMLYCSVESIEAEAFSGMLDYPVHLVLNANELTNLTWVTDPCQFDVIEVSSSPLECDCEVYDLVSLDFIQVKGKCTAPKRMAGMRLDSEEYKTLAHRMCGESLRNLTLPLQMCDWMYEINSGNSIVVQKWALLALLLLINVYAL